MAKVLNPLFDSVSESLLDSAELQQFVASHLNDSPAYLKLSLSGKSLPFDLDFALVQIAARKKGAKKLSSFLSHPAFMFPSDIASQQASDQFVARFHSSLAPTRSRWLDLTAGLGIDALSAALAGHEVEAVEIESWKCDVLRHNASLFIKEDDKLIVPEIICDDAVRFLGTLASDSTDVIFIDPARRSDSGQRLFSLSDCFPDAAALMPEMLRVAETVMVKCSPMLDAVQTLRQLPETSDLYTIDVRGECKELLAVCRRGFSGIPTLHAVEIDNKGNASDFSWKGDLQSGSAFYQNDNEKWDEHKIRNLLDSGDHIYLYEPSAALLKLHPDAAILSRYPDMVKADVNTWVYFSHSLHSDFPGRVMEVVSVIGKKEQGSLKGRKLSVVSRNYPMGSEEIKRKFRLRESPENFLYSFRLSGKPTFIESKIIKS